MVFWYHHISKCKTADGFFAAPPLNNNNKNKNIVKNEVSHYLLLRKSKNPVMWE